MMPTMNAIDQIINWNRHTFPLLALVYFLGGPALVYFTHRRSRRFARFLLIAPFIVLVFGLVYNAPHTNDDAYIFFRYAENVSSGDGLCYNAGELCEGYTSTLWLLILSAASMISSVLVSAKVLGALCAVLALWFMLLFCRRVAEPNDKQVMLVALLIPASSQLFLSYCMSGMDVALFVAWEALFLLLITERRKSSEIGLWLVTAIGVWIRPEASLVIGLGWLWRLWRDHRLSLSASIYPLLLLVAVLAAPFTVRQVLYADWLPNTFYAKSDRTLRNGIGFLLGAVNELGPLVWLVALIGLWQLRKPYGILLIVATALGIDFVFVGGDVLIQRFSTFWIPILTVGAVVGMRRLFDSFGSARSIVLTLLAALLCARGAYQAYRVVNPSSQAEGYGYVSSNSISTLETDAAIGHFLAEHGEPGDCVVTDNIGALGYYSRMRIVDVNGLTDNTIAQLIKANDTEGIEDYIHRQKAEWIVCYAGQPDDEPPFHLNRQGLLGPWISDEYSYVDQWWSRSGYRRVLLKNSSY